MRAIHKENLKHTFITAFFYAFFTLPLHSMASLIPGTEIRITSFMPSLFGFIWGFPGAVGICLGNIILDMISQYSPYVILWGGIGNFLLAYLPYKLWYSYDIENTNLQALSKSSHLVKYLLILLITSIAGSAFLAFTSNYAGVSPARDFFLIVFRNNFDTSLLLGTPILVLLSGNGFSFKRPDTERIYSPEDSRRWDLFFLLTNAGIILLLSFTNWAPKPFCVFFQACLLMYSLKPFYKLPSFKKSPVRCYTLQFKITLGMLLFTLCFVLLMGFMSFSAGPAYTRISLVQRYTIFYNNVFYPVHLIFILFLLLLWLSEQQFSNPLLALAQSTRQFIKQDLDAPLPKMKLPDIRSGDEIEVLTNSFDHMAKDLYSYITLLKESISQRERIEAELNIAMHIQSSLLPPLAPLNQSLPSLLLTGQMFPAREVGGDFYDAFLVDKHHLALIIADVSGKGIPAALFMAIAKTQLHTNTLNGLSPADIFYKTNNSLSENNPESMFVTTFLGILDLETGILQYANAGHCRPIILTKEGPVLLKNLSGPMLGSMEDIPYKEFTQQLSPGELLFLYTDGVTEAQNQNAEFFGRERVETELAKMHTIEEKEQAASTVHETILGFCQGTEPYDDLTILTL